MIHHKIKYGVGNNKISNILKTKIKTPKLIGPMEKKPPRSFYVLVPHAKQNCLHLKKRSTTHPFLNTKGLSYITVQGNHKEVYIYGVFKYF